MSRVDFDSALYEELLASFADNLYVFDRDLHYAFVTPTGARALGLEPAQVIGKSWRQLGLPPMVMEPVEAQVRTVFTTGAAIREETLFHGPAGPRYYEYILTPLQSGGEVHHVTVIGRDITDRKQAEARRVEVLESMGDAFFALDSEWRIVLVNRLQEKVSRTSRKETLGKNFWEVFPATASPSSKYWIEYHRVMNERVPREFEEYYEPLDLWTEVRAFPTEDGGISVFFRDVTERKRSEERLKTAHEFERKILAIVGHDVRNPLGAIDMAAQLVLRLAEPSSAIEKNAERIRHGVDRIRHIVVDLLDFTRARQGGIPISLERTNLEALCRQVCDELESLASDRQLQITCEGDAVGSWDPHRIGQAVSNLVGNAIQHSPPGTPIAVAVRGDKGSVVLEVRNQGQIETEALPVIFDPFRRGTTHSKSPGLGLGLYIAQTIVAAHHGSIEVSSTAESGTTFRITLPRRPNEMQLVG